MAEERCKCGMCGKELTDANSWQLPEQVSIRKVPYCLSCQGKVYTWLSSVVGYKLALFMQCAMMNIPYLPTLFEGSKEFAKDKGPWIGYVIAVRKADKERGKIRGFEQGLTDLKKAFKQYATLQVDDEMLNAEEYQTGKKLRLQLWGPGPKENPYSEDDYETLEKQYAALTEERPNRSYQAELAIQKICRWTLEQEKCIERKEFNDAQKLGQLIKNEMESEEFRAKDRKQSNVARLDDIVLAIERVGLNIPDEDELLTMLANHSFHPRYPYCRDAADQMLLQIINASNWNEGKTEWDRLPEELKIIDDMDEFAETPDNVEKHNYKELQLVPMTSKST